MTGLRSALKRYLSMRQGLGYKYQHQARRLADFVSFMEKRNATTITTKLALAWATLPPDRHASWALRLTDVRGFARHVANIDPETEVPPAGILPPLKRAKSAVKQLGCEWPRSRARAASCQGDQAVSRIRGTAGCGCSTGLLAARLCTPYGVSESANLPEPVDLSLVVDTYHQVENRTAYVAKSSEPLRPSRRLAIVDFKVEAPADSARPIQ